MIESAASARQSSVTFSISSSPPENDDHEEAIENEDENEEYDTAEDDQMASRYWLTVPNPLHQIRRLSDQGLRSARESIRRLSSSGSKFFRNANIARILQESSTTNANHHHHNNRNNVRKGSADPMSILKAQRDLELNCSRHHGLGFSRKSVSFCQRDNVHVYENDEAEEVTDDSAEENNDDFVDHLLTDNEPQVGDKSLVPCFVFAGKKPGYADLFQKSTMILESVDISEEDMCLMGNVRVNLAKLQKVAANRRRVVIIARYTTDDWVTSKDTKAMIVKAQSHPALSHFVTKAMRFYIDCDDLTVGDVLKFSLHCYASQNNKQYFLDNDDNEGLCYQVNCTPKLNPWAAKAAQELKNYAPIVKYNCLHKDADVSSDTVKSFSEDSLKS